MDSDQVSRETLLEIIAELRQRVESLEARLSSGGGPGARMPGHKPAARRKEAAREGKKPRRKRQHGFAQPRMEPAAQVSHAPESCPECHTTLSGGWVQLTREVIELPVSPAKVTEHVFIARTCPLCRKRRLPQDHLKGLAAGRQRLGANLVSLIATLREEGQLPVRTIQWYLRTFHQLKLSVGAIVRAFHQVARQGGPEVGEVLERIRSSPVVHADETGWRENGRNGCAWTFSTPTERLFLRRGRGKGVVDEVLGESFEGILVSDFYTLLVRKLAFADSVSSRRATYANLLCESCSQPRCSAFRAWATNVQIFSDACRRFPLSISMSMYSWHLVLMEKWAYSLSIPTDGNSVSGTLCPIPYNPHITLWVTLMLLCHPSPFGDRLSRRNRWDFFRPVPSKGVA